jgi:glycerophosphoryl diester phosphodiesterase
MALARAADASGLGAWWAWLSPEVCAAAHRAALHAHAWGLDQPPREDQVAMLVRAGVDTLDANDPRLLRRILDAL